jgi:hypothetical protein
MLDPNSLMASVLWGAIGAGFVAYGKKQGKAPALVGGLCIVGATFFVYSPLALAAVCALILLGVYAANRYGF